MRYFLRELLPVLAPAVVLIIVTACGGAGREDPILRLAAEESLEKGKELMEQEKYVLAREYLNHAFEVEPNSASGREALFLAADSHYLQGGHDNYVRAESKYRDFLNRFPTSDRGDYVQFQIANSLAKRIGKPDRDQQPTHEALEAYQELIRLYPGSEYAAQAGEQVAVVRNQLAEHEFGVGHFYLRMRNPFGATQRLEELLENFPEYPERDKVLYYLAQAYRMTKKEEEADNTIERLREEYPDSQYLAKQEKG